MKVSTKGDYATRALLDLALNEEKGPASVRDIAERTSLPQAYLEQIMLTLKAAGLVTSKRGVQGGYLLARPADEITLEEVIDVTEGHMAPLGCADVEPDHSCVEEGHCALQLVWVRVRGAVSEILSEVTLGDIAEQTKAMRKSGLSSDTGQVRTRIAVTSTPH